MKAIERVIQRHPGKTVAVAFSVLLLSEWIVDATARVVFGV